jgi:CDP-paratose 2-epimerase
MSIIVTGSAGLIGSVAAGFFAEKGFEVLGVDNDMRSHFFGAAASTDWNRDRLIDRHSNYRHHQIDIRDESAIDALFKENDVELVIHAAAQPSHDWSVRDPKTDFSVNATGTLILLEAARAHCPESPFIFTSTNKVYGDKPNRLPLVECETRWEIEAGHPYEKGIDEQMSVDQCTHSLFGVSKLAADALVQEYGLYFGMKTMVFRGGCLTGPLHSGAELHGFLAYLVQCILTGTEYRIFGYKGKQVRDNLHAYDLVSAFHHAFQAPRSGEVYNMGGSRFANVSMLEAIEKIEVLTGRKARTSYVEENRIGDHIWYISDVSKFQSHFPAWQLRYDIDTTLAEMVEAISARN